MLRWSASGRTAAVDDVAMSGVELRELRMQPSAEYRRREWGYLLTLGAAGMGLGCLIAVLRNDPLLGAFALALTAYILWGTRRRVGRAYAESSVAIDGDEVQLRGPSAPTVLGRRASGRVVIAHVEWTSYGRTLRDEIRLFVDDRGYSHPYALEASAWDLAVVDRMCAALSIPRVVETGVVDWHRLQERYPVDPALSALERVRVPRWMIVVIAVLIGLVVALNLLLRL